MGTKNFYQSLFCGPTQEQKEQIAKQQIIEIEYMRFVRENPGADIEKCQLKYSELCSEN